jgi:ATP-dependent DNA helicase PIF1
MLLPEQQEAYDLVAQGKSICLTGPGGSGKSFIINYIIQNQGTFRKVAVTALTGIASTYIKGMTLHSWGSVSVQANKEKNLAQILQDPDVVGRWASTDLLIVDEVSMMSAELLNKLDFLGRKIRKKEEPLGGLQVVFSGDFYQLPPIGTNERYCFESATWSSLINKTFCLQKIIRQSEPELQLVLNEIRQGIISTRGKELLNSRLISNLVMTEGSVKPTLIYPHKQKVNEINQQQLDLLIQQNIGEKVHRYYFKDETKIKTFLNASARGKNISPAELEEYLDQHCQAEKELQLIRGAQVMLTVNLDVVRGLVNGLTGIVVGFDTSFDIEIPIVQFHNGLKEVIKPFTWAPDHPRYLLKRTQIPLILAWAITVHRSQGATLACVRADLREAFGPGMAYVILSRITSLSGLYLEGINYSKIKSDSRVRDFYKNKTPIMVNNDQLMIQS